MLFLNDATAPGLAPGAVLDACARRGFAGVEVTAAEGACPRTLLEHWAAESRTRGTRIAGIRLPGLAAAADPALAGACARAGAYAAVPAGTGLDAGALAAAAARYADAGAELLLAHDTDPETVPALVEIAGNAGPSVGLAWEVRPGADRHELRAEVLRAAAPRLRCVRLFGGGPEAHGQTGQGVGSLMAHLALARWSGPLVLAPSRADFRGAWARWLGGRASCGCGGRVGDASLVVLDAAS